MAKFNPRSWRSRLGVALAVMLAWCSPAVAEDLAVGLRKAEPMAVGMEAEPLARISQRMMEFVQAKQVSGAVTLVARNGAIVHHEAVGDADVEGGRPMRKDSLFAIASMTKPITATAVMILRDEGKLSLDDPVSKHLPAFREVTLRDGGRPQQEMTIRHLLTHTSGLGGSQQNQGTLAETVELLARRPLDFEPGSKWQYSPGLSVCGRIVEVVSRQPFEDFLAERIFRPLGMGDTSFHPTTGQQERIARLYQPTKDKQSIEATTHWLSDLSEDRTPNPSGGLFSTAEDMARFYQMILGGGQYAGRRILSKAAVEEMTRVQTGELTTGFTPGNGWGLGWCVVREPQGVTQMLSPGSHGHGGAFGTQGWIDPSRQMIFVLLIQRTNFGNSDASDLRAALQQAAVDAIQDQRE
jgi:CubicO group peptidase (beta-lactamase class C family)